MSNNPPRRRSTMDPSYSPYSQSGSSHRSLSSATAHAQYDQYENYQQPSGYAAAPYPAQGYDQSHPYQGSSQRPGYPAYQHDQHGRQLPATYAFSSSASYPGAAGEWRRHAFRPSPNSPPRATTAQSSSHRHMPVAGDGRTLSAPGAQPSSYAAADGQIHLPLPQPSSNASGSGYHQLPTGYAMAQSHAPAHPPSSPYANRYLPTPAQQTYQPRATTSAASAAAPPPLYAPSVSPGLERFPCDKCEKTFSRAHDRKRHYESQHSAHPYVHKCRYCKREFSRADSLKRHLDNGCDKDPSYTEA